MCVYKDNCFLKGFPESGGVGVCVCVFGEVLMTVCVPGEETQRQKSVCVCTVHREKQRDLKNALKKESWRGLNWRASCLHLRWQSDSQMPHSCGIGQVLHNPLLNTATVLHAWLKLGYE